MLLLIAGVKPSSLQSLRDSAALQTLDTSLPCPAPPFNPCKAGSSRCGRLGAKLEQTSEPLKCESPNKHGVLVVRQFGCGFASNSSSSQICLSGRVKKKIKKLVLEGLNSISAACIFKGPLEVWSALEMHIPTRLPSGRKH